MRMFVYFIIIVCVSIPISGLQCYTCTWQEGADDNSCVIDPAKVTSGSPVTKCNKHYCTSMRQEYRDSSGSVKSFYRNCENNPSHMNSMIEDDVFITYYKACRQNLCNGDSGKDPGDINDDNNNGHGILRVPGNVATNINKTNYLTIITFIINIVYKI